MSARNNIKLDKEVDEILDDPVSASRWAALIHGLQLVDKYEKKYNLPETEIDSLGLLKYIDETAPILEAQLYADKED